MKQTLGLLAAVILMLLCQPLFSQVSVTTDGSAPHPSAMFDIKSTSKGLLIPRMTNTEMNLISSPLPGLMLYNTSDNNFYFYNGTGWGGIVGSSDGDWGKAGINIYSAVAGNVGIGTTAPTQILHVVGNIRLTGNIYDAGNLAGTSGQVLTSTGTGTDWVDQAAISDGDWTKQGIHMYSAVAGNVGIGVTAPIYQLQVSGSSGVNFGRIVHIENTSTASAFQMWGLYTTQNSTATSNPGAAVMGYAAGTAGANAGVRGESAGDNGKGIYGWATHATGVNYGVFGQTSSVNGFAGYFIGGKNYFEGNVGIGTTLPTQDLHVTGNMRLTGNYFDAGNQAGTSGQLLASTGTGTDWVDQVAISDGDWTKQGIHMYSAVAGNVGIGVTAPIYQLQVSGSSGVTFGRIVHIENTSTASASQMWGLYSTQNSTATSNPGAAVMGYAAGTAGANAGVRGESAGDNGKGIHGWASHATGVNYGVFGQTSSVNGFAGYFIGGKNYFEGNVGIGTTLPTQDLHVTGNMRLTGNYFDAGNQAGTSGQLLASTGTGTDWVDQAAISDGDWTKQGANIYSAVAGNVGIGTTNPVSKLHVLGKVEFICPSTGNGVVVNAATALALVYVDNSYAGNTWGLSAGLSSASAGSASYGLYGFNNGAGYGVYGAGNGSTATAVYGKHSGGNFGFMGSSFAGAWGENINGNYGYLGGSAFAVVGSYPSGSLGYLGGSVYGAYGELKITTAGAYGVYGYGVATPGVNGTGYGSVTSLGGVKGYNLWGNNYTFGAGGFSDLDLSRSGGAIGAKSDGTVWGSLGYRNSGSVLYGGYFTSYTSGAGKSAQAMINNGIGAWGDLFGADIHGEIYGAFIEGGNYASYSNGNVFKNGLDIHLQKDKGGKNVVLYTNVTTNATVQTCGYATLTNGQCDVSFDESFTATVSSDEPVVVTVTPMGNSGGVYLSSVSKTGFTVVENNNGKSSVTISFIAIGKRTGYENPALPQEVLASDYTEKVARGLHNDADTKTEGEGLFYEDGKLTVGKHPSTYPNPGKPSEDKNKVKADLPRKAAPSGAIGKGTAEGSDVSTDK